MLRWGCTVQRVPHPTSSLSFLLGFPSLLSLTVWDAHVSPSHASQEPLCACERSIAAKHMVAAGIRISGNLSMEGCSNTVPQPSTPELSLNLVAAGSNPRRPA